MKQAVLNLMCVTGAFAPFRLANRHQALILTYHRFCHTGDGRMTSARSLAAQLDYLTARYRIISLSRLVEYLTSGKRLPPDIAVITIDDGYRDAYEIAFPILRRYNATATLFVVTGFVDRTVWMWPDKLRFLTTHARAQRLEAVINHRAMHLTLNGRASRLEAAERINAALKVLPDQAKEEAISQIASSLGVELSAAPPAEYGAVTWPQVREMNMAGIEIGSHTVTHPILTGIGEERLRVELCQSRSRLEAMLGRAIDLFCYPNGDYDQRVRRAAQEAGYRCAVTIEAGLNKIDSDPMQLRRVHTESNFARFVECTSGFEQIKNRLLRSQAKTTNGHAYS
ncbi:MAG TPA: polysaccharide deacetylase family protein [Blastocatellia bacterium]